MNPSPLDGVRPRGRVRTVLHERAVHKFERMTRAVYPNLFVVMVKRTLASSALIHRHRRGEVLERDQYAFVVGIRRGRVEVWAPADPPERVAFFSVCNPIRITSGGGVLLKALDQMDATELELVEYRRGGYRTVRGRRLNRLASELSGAIGPTSNS